MKDAYKELGIQGLPTVMLFKNGEKTGEVIGCVDPKRIQVVLARSMPGLKIPETATTTTTTTTTAASPIKIEENPGGCRVCQLERIVKLLHSHPSDGIAHERHEISIHKLAANTEHCNYCRFLMQTCQKDPSLLEHVKAVGGEVTISTKRDKGLARLDLDGTRKDGIRNTARFKSRILQRTRLSEAQDDSTHFSGRFVEKELEFGLCRWWLVNCRKYHGKTCRREVANLSEIGLRLIDINTHRIVDAPADAKYAALSYVWGDAKQLKLNHVNFERLTRVGGLSDDHSDIPKTIRDAITVASKLKFNYLWVDALCIKQDDDADKLRQIAQMDKVYNCAALTIVSTGPNADTEIPGLRSPSRTPNQVICKIGDVQLINSLPTLSQALSISRWDHRGWTLQEKALSKRLLIFTESQVFWHCNSAIYAEDTNLELSSKDPRSLNQVVEHYEEYSTDLKRIYKPSPTDSAEDQYVSLLRSYMTRDLTDQGDAVNAFTGVLNALQSELGSHRWGLPTHKFDGAMLWQLDGHFPERRREKFPSWSWAGWTGGADVQMNASGLDTVSRILWWKIDDTGVWVKLNPDRTIEPESGYTNEFFGVDSPLPPPNPDDIPINYSEEIPKHIPGSHLLRFWTSLARLVIGRKPVRSRGGNCSEYPVYVVGQEHSVSTVVLDDSWLKDRKDDEVDVIFLSRAGEGYKFKYDIKVWTMIIEWKDKVAYRVQQVVFPIRLIHWEAAKPQFKLVTLA